MGCSTSITKNQVSKSEKAIKAAILIQRWYRSYMARMEMRRRYALSIFQSIEYAEEQSQLQLSNFFTFMLDHFTQADGTDPDISSHISSSAADCSSDPAMKGYERTIEVPASYRGPHLSFPLTVADTDVLLQAFKHRQQLHARYVIRLLQETRKVLQQMPNITQLSTSYAKEITICGDLHGNLDDLLLIFYKFRACKTTCKSIKIAPPALDMPSLCEVLFISQFIQKRIQTEGLPPTAAAAEFRATNGLPSEENPYIFNGDFVDRGKNSIEILIILFAFLLVYPNRLHLNRGNHEDHIINLRYGFTKEVMRKYQCHGQTILRLLQDVYSWLPLATIIDNKVLIVHGGISDTTDLHFLNLFQRSKLKSVLRPPKTKVGTISDLQEAQLDMAHNQLKEDNKCCSWQEASNKEAMRSASASCGRRECSSREEPDDRYHSHPYLEVRHFQPCSVSTSHSSPELTKKEWKQVVDILWSDPKHQNGCTPNKNRGGGCYFGPDITAMLLKRYNLKMLIRSHECKQEGYEISHNGKVITIFSASNYYEEGSNRGAYIKLNPDLIPRFVQYQVRKSTRKQTLHQRVTTIELSALKCLREKLYAHKSELITAFRHYDPNNTGKISPTEWASAMESVLHLDLPWRTLRSRLVYAAQDGNIEYLSSFDDLEIKLPIKEVNSSLVETLCRYKADLEIIFNIIDRDNSGFISIDEFRQTWKLFNLHLKINIDDESIDNLARSMDFNKDGSIDFNEFLEAFHVVHKFESKYCS